LIPQPFTYQQIDFDLIIVLKNLDWVEMLYQMLPWW